LQHHDGERPGNGTRCKGLVRAIVYKPTGVQISDVRILREAQEHPLAVEAPRFSLLALPKYIDYLRLGVTRITPACVRGALVKSPYSRN
jgi:hypothetical protein